MFAPSLIEMASATIKNKYMAKVAAWASLLPVPAPTDGDVSDGDAFKFNSTKQKCYGNFARFCNKFFVSSYEEVYDDKNRSGKFTLVMQCVGAPLTSTAIMTIGINATFEQFATPLIIFSAGNLSTT